MTLTALYGTSELVKTLPFLKSGLLAGFPPFSGGRTRTIVLLDISYGPTDTKLSALVSVKKQGGVDGD